jgi:hypothetical protein
MQQLTRISGLEHASIITLNSAYLYFYAGSLAIIRENHSAFNPINNTI